MAAYNSSRIGNYVSRESNRYGPLLHNNWDAHLDLENPEPSSKDLIERVMKETIVAKNLGFLANPHKKFQMSYDIWPAIFNSYRWATDNSLSVEIKVQDRSKIVRFISNRSSEGYTISNNLYVCCNDYRKIDQLKKAFDSIVGEDILNFGMASRTLCYSPKKSRF